MNKGPDAQKKITNEKKKRNENTHKRKKQAKGRVGWEISNLNEYSPT